MTTEYQEINIIDYIRTISKHKVLILAVTIICLALGIFLYSKIQNRQQSQPTPPTYRSISTIMPGQFTPPLPALDLTFGALKSVEISSLHLSDIAINQTISVVNSDSIRYKIFERAGYNPSKLPSSKTLTVVLENGIIKIEVKSVDKEIAQKVEKTAFEKVLELHTNYFL